MSMVRACWVRTGGAAAWDVGLKHEEEVTRVEEEEFKTAFNFGLS